GVYLPLSSSAPLFVGGMVRWLVDRRNSKLAHNAHQTEEEKQSAGDRSSGVLLASGYIAGGALAGIIIAFTAGILTDFDQAIGAWAEKNNPFFEGMWSDALSLLPYAVIVGLLYWVGREKKAAA
ncbi:MAG TPA: OPT/YSL family transporter, partial [Burkholderiaceae bacterium]|nr:OPT/YSL family transporter [Burkholderiaceae bacterium]